MLFSWPHNGTRSLLPVVWPHTSKTNANWYDTDRLVSLCTSGEMLRACMRVTGNKSEREREIEKGRRRDETEGWRKREETR